jgi:hypothetical protein
MGRPLLFIFLAIVAVASFLAYRKSDNFAEKRVFSTNSGPSRSDEPLITKPTTATPVEPIKIPSMAPGNQAFKGEAVPPSFDVVRVSPNGELVIAGRGTPGLEVIILENDWLIGRATADQRGEWVFVPEIPLKPGKHQLSLKTRLPGAELDSPSVVAVMVPEAADGQAMAVKLPRDGGDSTLLQVPGKSEIPPLAINLIDQLPDGNLTIGGIALPDSVVLVYLDNQYIGRATTDEKGNWRLRTEGNPNTAKAKTVRADETTKDGKVTKRAEAPFARVAMLERPAHDMILVIEPGSNLWRIARKIYGSGTAYTTIYAANREQIRDPNLIYPGQVFAVPTSIAPALPGGTSSPNRDTR